MEKKYKPCAKCKKCFWGGPVNLKVDNKMVYSCDYFILTGQRRPCPAGPGCTAFNPRSKASRTIPNHTRLSNAERKARKNGTLHH